MNAKQHWNAAGYAVHAHFVPALGQPVLDLLNPQPSERILDLGCGDGVLTEKLAAAGVNNLAESGEEGVSLIVGSFGFERSRDPRTPYPLEVKAD